MENKDEKIILADDPNLAEISIEADSLYVALNKRMAKIGKAEKILNNRKSHFPFEKLVEKSESRASITVKDKHISIYPNIEKIFTRKYSYLSWASSKIAGINSKDYRLFLIEEESEIGCSGKGENYKEKVFSSKCVIMKPLIEANVPTRIKYLKYFDHFISSYKDYLKQCRIAVEAGENPFKDNE